MTAKAAIKPIDALRDALINSPRTAKELQDLLGFSLPYIYSTLSRLLAQDKVQKIGKAYAIKGSWHQVGLPKISEADNQKRTRFKRIATARVNSALSKIRLLGNLSNKNIYSYEKEDAEKVIQALQSAIESLSNRLSRPGARRDETFRF